MSRCTAKQRLKLIEEVMEEYDECKTHAMRRIAKEVGLSEYAVQDKPTLRWGFYRLASILLLDEDPGRNE